MATTPGVAGFAVAPATSCASGTRSEWARRQTVAAVPSGPRRALTRGLH